MSINTMNAGRRYALSPEYTGESLGITEKLLRKTGVA
jgi:hypothetical protein